jgi:hypothetical protein
VVITGCTTWNAPGADESGDYRPVLLEGTYSSKAEAKAAIAYFERREERRNESRCGRINDYEVWTWDEYDQHRDHWAGN